MRILITGHKGFLGSQLYKKLENKNEVHGFDCGTYQEFEVAFQDFKRRGGKFDVFLHCGAVSNSEDTSNTLWQLNYQASTQIADYCEQTDTKLIFISSATAIEPETPYGWSKHCAEFYMRQKIAGMNLCILRPYNIWGFEEKGKENPSIVYKILTGQLTQVYWNCERDFIYISDVMSTVLQVVNNWTPGIFSVGTAKATDISTLVNYLYEGSGCRYPKPPVTAECPITQKLVATAGECLPNWKATPLSEYFDEMCQFMQNETDAWETRYRKEHGLEGHPDA